tara:strand:+ start:30322 stop:30549 length:228 start_codon:yes stop_codon:yes gene_type:complete
MDSLKSLSVLAVLLFFNIIYSQESPSGFGNSTYNGSLSKRTKIFNGQTLGISTSILNKILNRPLPVIHFFQSLSK